MQKNIALIALIMLCSMYTTQSMEISVISAEEEKMAQLAYAMLERPAQSYELIHALIEENKDQIGTIDPSTGNTPLHEQVIEACWADKPVRLLPIAILLACGADRHQKNYEGLTPIECAQIAGNQAVLELLNEKNPTKQTVLTIVKKYRIDSLNPMLLEQ